MEMLYLTPKVAVGIRQMTQSNGHGVTAISGGVFPTGSWFLDNLLFSESRRAPASNRYCREAESFIYCILGFTRKEISSFKTVTLIGLNSSNSTLLSLFTELGLSSSAQ